MKLAVFALSILLVSCGTRSPKENNVKEGLIGVWDYMAKKTCYERYVFYAGDTFSYFGLDRNSNGSFNLKDSTLGLYHQGAAADYLPFEIMGDGRMSLFKNGTYQYYVKVPNEYAMKVACPGDIPDDDDGGGDYPNPTPTKTPKPQPTKTPTPIPDPDNGGGNCKCCCPCDSNSQARRFNESNECFNWPKPPPTQQTPVPPPPTQQTPVPPPPKWPPQPPKTPVPPPPNKQEPPCQTNGQQPCPTPIPAPPIPQPCNQCCCCCSC